MNNPVKKALIAFLVIFPTFGIGSTLYIFLISDKMSADSENRIIYPAKEAVLNLITLGIYGIVWTYRTSCLIDKRNGFTEFSASTLICTLLSCFPLRCISMALLIYRLDDAEMTEYGEN